MSSRLIAKPQPSTQGSAGMGGTHRPGTGAPVPHTWEIDDNGVTATSAEGADWHHVDSHAEHGPRPLPHASHSRWSVALNVKGKMKSYYNVTWEAIVKTSREAKSS